MPNVYTIFALGTNEESKQENDYRGLIAQFSEACHGDKLILEGPKGIRGIHTVKKNIDIAIEGILNWVDANQDEAPYIINMAGFSRGGVLCLRVANRLKKYIEQDFKDYPGDTKIS